MCEAITNIAPYNTICSSFIAVAAKASPVEGTV